MIAVKSNKVLQFPPTYRGIVTMEIDMIINRPEAEAYEMRIIDTCTKIVQKEVPVIGENGQLREETEMKDVIEVQGKPTTRFKLITYDEIDVLTEALGVDMTVGTLRENINELFRRVLLFITQKECGDGINGESGFGMYFTEAKDWEIV